MRSLFYIQDFDKFNNFTGTSTSRGKICIKTFTFYICNTRVIFKISECFFEWIVSAMKLLVWNIRNFKLINCFREKIIKKSHSLSSFGIFPLSNLFFAFWEFVRKAWRDSFLKSLVISNFANVSIIEIRSCSVF